MIGNDFGNDFGAIQKSNFLAPLIRQDVADLATQLLCSIDKVRIRSLKR
jgi:hypothetical protein